MNVVDSSGWIEYFVGGPNSPFFDAPLQRRRETPGTLIYAAAQAHDATLWTQDADFEGPAGVEYRPKR